MIEITGNLKETKELFKEIMHKPESMFELLDIDLKKLAERSISKNLKVELTNYLGREKN